jgi:KUP system potassium uptake protein
MLGILGIGQIVQDFTILKALNPYYAYKVLSTNTNALLLLSSVFLCTTGAEALYSDLGHCGKTNIRVSWIFVKTMLVLNYCGQGAWLISHAGFPMSDFRGGTPFSGSFTLINEAMRLNFWPKVKVVYPSDARGQLYIPSVNWLLMWGCIGITLYFKESANMGAAYGLAIVLTMIMTTTLLNYYMILKRYNRIFITVVITVYGLIETGFFIAARWLGNINDRWMLICYYVGVVCSAKN